MAFFHNRGVYRPGEEEEIKRRDLAKKLYEEREKFVICLLIKNEIDIDEFTKSNIFNNPNRHDLIEHIYGQIKGYDFSNKIEESLNRQNKRCLKIVGCKKPNGHEMDLDTLKIYFVNKGLILKDKDAIYKYEIDEHCLIYLNGKYVIGQQIPTEEEIRKSRQQLHDDIKSSMARAHRDTIDSMEFAKSYYVK